MEDRNTRKGIDIALYERQKICTSNTISSVQVRSMHRQKSDQRHVLFPAFAVTQRTKSHFVVRDVSTISLVPVEA